MVFTNVRAYPHCCTKLWSAIISILHTTRYQAKKKKKRQSNSCVTYYSSSIQAGYHKVYNDTFVLLVGVSLAEDTYVLCTSTPPHDGTGSDGQTDGQTDRQMDGRADSHPSNAHSLERVVW